MHKTLLILLGFIWAGILFTCLSFTSEQNEPSNKKKLNVLFIAIDDLRPQLNCYGESQVISPTIDRLASESVVFSNAYCQVPVCGASRASLMTGVRPTKDRFWGYDCRADTDLNDQPTLAQWFKEHGYYTISNGKIFHHQNDSPESWSEKAWRPRGNNWRDYLAPANKSKAENTAKKTAAVYESPNVHDTAYYDGRIAQKTIRDLNKLSKSGQPFFLAMGFRKPHLPFNAPKKYWDLYKEEDFELPSTYNESGSAPKEAYHNFGELRAYDKVPATGPVHDTLAIKMIHGYHACVSYADACLKTVLDELKRLELNENTIVVLWGDHGWHLGDHGLWCKHSNFKVAMQVPLMIHVPESSTQQNTNEMVELVDLYPTLCDLTGLSKPKRLDGTSLSKLITEGKPTGKEEAYARFHYGESVIKKDHIFTQWYTKEGEESSAMLFDQVADDKETTNLVGNPEYKTLITNNRHQLDSLRIKN